MSMDDMLVMYFEDLMEYDEEYLKEARLRLLGMHAGLTGDPLIDEWNWYLDRGMMPDLDKGDHPEILAQDKIRRESMRRRQAETGKDAYTIATEDFQRKFGGNNSPQHQDSADFDEMARSDSHYMESRKPTTPEEFDSFVSQKGKFQAAAMKLNEEKT